MNFKIEIENFEGPIDVLLQMIEKRKMPISDVSLAEITDDYIRFVERINDMSLSNVTHFIFVASTLTLIKSKSLLPKLELSAEEEVDIEDLKKRLELFAAYQDFAKNIKSHFKKQKSFFYSRPRKKEISFQPHKDLQLINLSEALQSVLQEVPKKEIKKKEASIRIAVHIDEMMQSLEERIKKALSTDFSSFISGKITNKTDQKAVKVYNVVGFLAMLELVKKGALHVIQDKNFDSIAIESTQK